MRVNSARASACPLRFQSPWLYSHLHAVADLRLKTHLQGLSPGSVLSPPPKQTTKKRASRFWLLAGCVQIRHNKPPAAAVKSVTNTSGPAQRVPIAAQEALKSPAGISTAVRRNLLPSVAFAAHPAPRCLPPMSCCPSVTDGTGSNNFPFGQHRPFQIAVCPSLWPLVSITALACREVCNMKFRCVLPAQRALHACGSRCSYHAHCDLPRRSNGAVPSGCRY